MGDNGVGDFAYLAVAGDGTCIDGASVGECDGAGVGLPLAVAAYLVAERCAGRVAVVGVHHSGMSGMLPVSSSPLSCRWKMRRVGCLRRCCSRLSARFLAILSARCLTSSALSRRSLCLSHNFSNTSPATSSASSLPSSNDIALATAICRSSVTNDMYFRRSILIIQ